MLRCIQRNPFWLYYTCTYSSETLLPFANILIDIIKTPVNASAAAAMKVKTPSCHHTTYEKVMVENLR